VTRWTTAYRHRSRPAARPPARPSQLSFRWNFHGDPAAAAAETFLRDRGGDEERWAGCSPFPLLLLLLLLLADLRAVVRGRLTARLLIDAGVERRSKRRRRRRPGGMATQRGGGARLAEATELGWMTARRSIDLELR